MLNIPKFNGKEFPIPELGINYAAGAVESYDSFLEELQAVEGFTQHRLLDSFGGNPIYGFSMGNIEKPVMYIDGCIHKSHEWRTSYWIMHFMEVLNNPTLYPEMAHKIHDLKDKYSLYILPVAAPDTFISSTKGEYSYGNDNGVDIAQNFDYRWPETPWPKGSAPFSEPEAQNIRDIILNLKPVLYINCHSYGGSDRFVMRKPVNLAYEALYKDLNDSINISTPGQRYAGVAGQNSVSSSYNWASQQMSSQGRRILSNVFEVGVLEYSREQSAIGVAGLLLHMIHADNYLTNNSLTMY